MTVVQTVIVETHDPLRLSYQNRPYLRYRDQFNTSCVQCYDDCGNCIDVACCWHLQVSSQYDAITHGHRHHSPSIASCLLLCCADTCTFGIASVVCVALTRGRIRDRFSLRCDGGDCVLDAALFCCGCVPCMACQNHREMHMRGVFAGGCCSTPNMTYLNPPQKDTGMGMGGGGAMYIPQPHYPPAYPQQPPHGTNPAFAAPPPPPPAYSYSSAPVPAPNSTTGVDNSNGMQYGYTNNSGAPNQNQMPAYGQPQPAPNSPQQPAYGYGQPAMGIPVQQQCPQPAPYY